MTPHPTKFPKHYKRRLRSGLVFRTVHPPERRIRVLKDGTREVLLQCSTCPATAWVKLTAGRPPRYCDACYKKKRARAERGFVA